MTKDLGIGNYLCIIRTTYDKPISSIIVSGENANITIKFRNKAKLPPCSALNLKAKVPARAIREKNKMDTHQKGGKIKLSLFAYIGDPKDPIGKKLF